MIPPPSSTLSQDLADWAELCCLKTRRGQISRTDVVDQLKDYGMDGAEELCEMAWLELQRRSSAIAELYPFLVASSRLERKAAWDQSLLYSLLLLVGSSGHNAPLSKPQTAVAARLFEEIATLAIGRYAGGKALRIGHGRKAPVPSSFSALLTYLSRELGEGLLRTRPLSPNTKDCRADVIAWRPFRDRRGGQLVIFVQCAIGSGWTSKLTECSVKVWERYIQFVVTPLTAFAVPHVEPDSDRWLEYGSMGGIALDRLRLVDQLAEATLPSELEKRMEAWARAQMSVLPWDD